MPTFFEDPGYLKIILKFHTCSLLMNGILRKQKQTKNQPTNQQKTQQTFPPQTPDHLKTV